MFLLFVIIIGIICWFAYYIKWYRFDKARRDKAINNGESRYIDRNGNWVDIESNVAYRYVRETKYDGCHLYTGDIKIVNAGTGTVIRNLTEEKRIAANNERRNNKKKAIEDGEKYYLYDIRRRWGTLMDPERFECDHLDKLPKINTMWADVNTDQKYLIYRITFWDKTNERVDANVLWNIDSKKLETLIDEDRYTEEQLIRIRNEIEEANMSNKDYDWPYLPDYRFWSNELHVE